MLKKYRLTLVGFGLAVAIFSISCALQWDLLEQLMGFVQLLGLYEHLELDELIIALLILAVFYVFDLRRHLRLQRQEREKEQIYRAMLATNHHIMNNFLNQLQLFRLTAEDTPGFPAEELVLFDQIIHDTLRQLHNLESLTQGDSDARGDRFQPQNPAPAGERKTLREVVGTFLM